MSFSFSRGFLMIIHQMLPWFVCKVGFHGVLIMPFMYVMSLRAPMTQLQVVASWF